MHISLLLSIRSLQNRYHYYQVYFINFEKVTDLLIVTKLMKQGLNPSLLFLCCV